MSSLGLFGFSISADIEIPDLYPTASAKKLRIEKSEVPIGLSVGSDENGWMIYTRPYPHVLQMVWDGHFGFQIDFSHSVIRYTKSLEVSRESFLQFLLGPVLSCLIAHEGVEPLHGTVVSNGVWAVGLLGHSGYGKSTLAAEFVSQGWTLHSDDMVYVRNQVVLPGRPFLKLYPDSARAFEISSSADSLTMATEKKVFRLSSQPAAVPLRALIQLSPPSELGSEISIYGLSTKDAFRAALANMYNIIALDETRCRQQFHWADRLSRSLIFGSLHYPRDYSALPQVFKRVVSWCEGLHGFKEKLHTEKTCELQL